MKLVRYGRIGKEKPGIIAPEGKLRDLSGLLPDLTAASLAPKALSKLARAVARAKPASLPLVGGKLRFGVPVANIGKFIAIGLNYADHAAEAGMAEPKEPIIFIWRPSVACPARTMR
jgi:2,4-didehydro-3-deoxy-L-rhamnonate hydrolase